MKRKSKPAKVSSPARYSRKKQGMGISYTEFGKRDGCAVTTVSAAVHAGVLTPYADKTLDPALVGTGWRSSNRKKIALEAARASQAAGEDLPGAAALGDLSINGAMNLADAERAKVVYEVLKRKRLHDQEIGSVVLVDDVATALAREYQQVRNKLLAIPSEHAPRLSMLKSAAEVQDYLLGAITKALEALTQ